MENDIKIGMIVRSAFTNDVIGVITEIVKNPDTEDFFEAKVLLKGNQSISMYFPNDEYILESPERYMDDEIISNNNYTITELVTDSNEQAGKSGFWDAYRMNHTWCSEQDRCVECDDCGYICKIHINSKLMLITSEVSEAMEVLRKQTGGVNVVAIEPFGEELADIMIRTADLAGELGIDLESIIVKKMQKNAKRPKMHGKAF